MMPFPVTTTQQRVLMMNRPQGNFTAYIDKLEQVAMAAQAVLDTHEDNFLGSQMKDLREALLSAASESSSARGVVRSPLERRIGGRKANR
jgi:hypothetical protein